MPETLDQWFRRVFLGHKDPNPVRVRSIRDPDTEAILGWFWTCDNIDAHRYGQPETKTTTTGDAAIAGALEHVELHRRYEQLRDQLGSKPL